MPASVQFDKVYAPVSKVLLVGDRDSRGELIRVRLSDDDFARISAIQDHLESVGLLSTLGKVMSNAIASYYDALVAEGSVPPNL